MTFQIVLLGATVGALGATQFRDCVIRFFALFLPVSVQAAHAHITIAAFLAMIWLGILAYCNRIIWNLENGNA